MADASSPLSALWSSHALKFLRYSGVSAFNVVFGYFLLAVFYKVVGLPGWFANLLAVLLGSIPAFFLNKRYVWRHAGPTRVRAELMPFLTMNGLGLAASTGAVHVADQVWGTPAAILVASLMAWGSLWILKYVLLDRVLFHRAPGTAVAVTEAAAG